MKKIIKAIKQINPNAEFKYDDEDINSIEWLNGTTPIAKADIEAQIPTVEQEIIDEAQAKIDKKASAITKLKALGLDDDEINAIIGA
jgi:hypothetical protein